MHMANPDYPLGKHVKNFHQGISPKISFIVLDRVHPNTRGGDWNKTLLQRETQWIVRLNATCPPSLNSTISYKPFLEGFSSGACEKDL